MGQNGKSPIRKGKKMDKEILQTLQAVKFVTQQCARQYFDNTRKTREIVKQALVSTREEAEKKQLIFESSEISETDLYCLNEINRQQMEVHYTQHHRLLLQALLITVYSSLEHTLANAARVIYRSQDQKPDDEIYLNKSLKKIKEIGINLNPAQIKKAHTLRKLRNILVHAKGEWLNAENISEILNETPHITKSKYGILDIDEKYLDECIETAEKIIQDLSVKLDRKINTGTKKLKNSLS